MSRGATLACAECGTSFVATNNRQRYCSKRCSMIVGSRRFKARWAGSPKALRDQRRRGWICTSQTRGWETTPEAGEYVRILAADPCVFCGDPSREIDHILPGAGNGWENLAAICKRCNRSKCDRPLLLALCGLNGAWYERPGLLEASRG